MNGWTEYNQEQAKRAERQEEFTNMIKLKSGNEYEITFLEDSFERRLFEYKGQEIESYEFKVRYNNEEKILPITSHKLMNTLIIMRDKYESLKDKTFEIIASGEGLDKTFTVIPKL